MRVVTVRRPHSSYTPGRGKPLEAKPTYKRRGVRQHEKVVSLRPNSAEQRSLVVESPAKPFEVVTQTSEPLQAV